MHCSIQQEKLSRINKKCLLNSFDKRKTFLESEQLVPLLTWCFGISRIIPSPFRIFADTVKEVLLWASLEAHRGRRICRRSICFSCVLKCILARGMTGAIATATIASACILEPAATSTSISVRTRTIGSTRSKILIVWVVETFIPQMPTMNWAF
jgi:hypothetical protein